MKPTKPIEAQGKFTAIGMRTPVTDPNAMVINTCSGNDTDKIGTATQWTWANPTNRAFTATHPQDPTIEAVSLECLWQGTKIFAADGRPDPRTLAGDWRRGKAKRPIGAWAGNGKPLHTTPGAARRSIYIPAFINQLYNILQADTRTGFPAITEWLQAATRHQGPIYLRDHDTGRGIERNGPMSHAWVMAEILNTGTVPGGLDPETQRKAGAIHALAHATGSGGDPVADRMLLNSRLTKLASEAGLL